MKGCKGKFQIASDDFDLNVVLRILEENAAYACLETPALTTQNSINFVLEQRIECDDYLKRKSAFHNNS